MTAIEGNLADIRKQITDLITYTMIEEWRERREIYPADTDRGLSESELVVACRTSDRITSRIRIYLDVDAVIKGGNANSIRNLERQTMELRDIFDGVQLSFVWTPRDVNPPVTS